MPYSDIHIDDFYKDAAKILVHLHMHFPRKFSLYVEDISGPDTPDEFGLHSPRHEATLHAMMWLANAGYLHYDSLIRQEAIENAVLSHRGFLTLNCPLPEPEENHFDETAESDPAPIPPAMANLDNVVVNRIRKELKEGNSFSIAELLRQVMELSRKFR